MGNRSYNIIIDKLKALGSLKLTVVCFLALIIVVVWGTVYQTDHGLFAAQLKFFHSWFIVVFGFIPLPGALLIMFVMILNLLFFIIFRIKFRISTIGNLITHWGIVVLLIGGFYPFYFSKASSIILMEGESANMSVSNRLWEIAIWEKSSGKVSIHTIDTDKLRVNDRIKLNEFNLNIRILTFYKNCLAFDGNMTGFTKIVNSSGINKLVSKASKSDPTKNIPGVILSIRVGNIKQSILLYGGVNLPTSISLPNKTFYFSLRQKRISLPLRIQLIDFKVKMYPNSSIPKSYESWVMIKPKEGIKREVLISMNKPLRYDDFTFFQSSYYIGQNGSEYSILSVVKKSGRVLTYIASGIIFMGLMIHFLIMLFLPREKLSRDKK